MANGMLAVKVFSCNDISLLAKLFDTSFEYYLRFNSPFIAEFLENIRTIAGLGYTAVLADNDLIFSYQAHLEDFLHYDNGNFVRYPSERKNIAQSLAHMVAIAGISFEALRCPPYYNLFRLHVKKAVTSIMHDLKEAQEILSHFFHQ